MRGLCRQGYKARLQEQDRLWRGQILEEVRRCLLKVFAAKKLTALAHRLSSPPSKSGYRPLPLLSVLVPSTLPILITSFKFNNLLDMPNNLLNLSLNPPLLKIYLYQLPSFPCKPPMLQRPLMYSNPFICGQQGSIIYKLGELLC